MGSEPGFYYVFYLLFLKYLLFLFWAALGLHGKVFFSLSCGMWDLVPRPGVKPEPPTLKVQRFSHWTIREVPRARFLESTSHNFVPST